MLELSGHLLKQRRAGWALLQGRLTGVIPKLRGHRKAGRPGVEMMIGEFLVLPTTEVVILGNKNMDSLSGDLFA
jgi:hypothetical protein